MVIDRNKLSKFLKVLGLKKNIENKEAIFNIGNNSLKAIICHCSKIVALRGNLKGEFDNIGDIGIDDVQFLTKCVKSFQGNINLSKKDNKLILKDDKLTISCILRNPTYIKNSLDNNKFDEILNSNTSNPIKLTENQIKELITYYNTVGSYDIILTNKNGKLAIISEKNENELIGIIDVDVLSKFKVKLSNVFMDILSLIDDDIEIKLGNDTPVSIKIDNDDYTFDILIQRKI